MTPSDGILIGVDIGSTACKVQACDSEGRLIRLISTPTPWEDRHAGRQLDCEVLLAQLLLAIAEVSGAHRVLGIGLTGFAESGVLMNRAGAAIAPVLPWYDQHGRDVLDRVEIAMGGPGFAGITGLPLNLKPSVMKFGWLMTEIAPRAAWHKWLSVPEWVAYRLTGELGTEPSLASRTGLFDVVGAREAGEVLALIDAPADLLSPLKYAGEPWGIATSRHPALAGAVVTVCGMDHLCAGVGVGALGQASLLDSCGTGEALIRRLPASGIERALLTSAVAQEIALGRDIFPDQVQLTASLRSGIGMWRFLKLMGKTGDDMEALDSAALALATTPASPIVRDVWLENASLANIPYDPDPAAVWRAVVEAVQRRAAVLSERMQSVAGPHDRIVATGGGLQSRLVRALKREILGAFEHSEIVESASKGAALFAGMAARVMPPIVVEPRPVRMARAN